MGKISLRVSLEVSYARARARVRIVRAQAQVKGRPAHYRTVGSGEPLVLVHGLAGSSLWWIRNLAGLAKRHTLYLVDLPGFGTMSWPRRRFVLADVADWLLAWMDAVGLESTHLTGHSMGGYISLHLAATHPERVKRLGLVAPALDTAGRSMLGNLVPVLRAGRYGDPRFYPILAFDSLRAGPLTLLRAARQLLNEEIQQDLRAVEAQTLLIWGANDTVVPARGGLTLKDRLPASRLLVIRGAGHVPMFDRPAEFNAALLDFLAGKPVGE